MSATPALAGNDPLPWPFARGQAVAVSPLRPCHAAPRSTALFAGDSFHRVQLRVTIDGIVYLVDALDRERFPEAKKELDNLLTDDTLATVPVLVLGNKIDAGNAASEEELRGVLGLTSTYGKEGKSEAAMGVRPIEVYMCSVVRRMGYSDGFKWIAQFL